MVSNCNLALMTTRLINGGGLKAEGKEGLRLAGREIVMQGPGESAGSGLQLFCRSGEKMSWG